jgi:hypothetical protein
MFFGRTTPWVLAMGDFNMKIIKERVIKNCLYCKKSYKVFPHDKNRRKYCSKKCSNGINNRLMKRSLSWRTKLSNNRKGKKNHFYINGLYPYHKRIRHSLEYKLWRTAVFHRDNWTCIWCGDRSRAGHNIRIEADHIKSFIDYPELRFAIDNGRTLCISCHRTTETYGVNKKI